jgi:Fe-S-cluster containining protein
MNLSAIIPAMRESDRVREALRSARTRTDFRRITAEWHEGVDRLGTHCLETRGAATSCRPGCSFCCYLRVAVHPDEVFAIVDFVRSRLSKGEVEELRRRAREIAGQRRSFGGRRQLAANLPCPLLKDGLCAAYEVRPTACRAYHAERSATCEYSFAHPEELDSPSSEFPDLAIAFEASFEAVQEAFVEGGFDCRDYDLAAAFAEALGDPDCESRWRKGKRAFAEACAIDD